MKLLPDTVDNSFFPRDVTIFQLCFKDGSSLDGHRPHPSPFPVPSNADTDVLHYRSVLRVFAFLHPRIAANSPKYELKACVGEHVDFY
jgi:hypothetical protein